MESWAVAIGWQYTVIIVGALGILPGLTAFQLPEPLEAAAFRAYRNLANFLRVPAFLALIVAGTCITFSTVSLVSWGADYVKNYKDFTLREAAISISVISLISLVLGVLSGGYFADLLQKRLSVWTHSGDRDGIPAGCTVFVAGDSV